MNEHGNDRTILPDENHGKDLCYFSKYFASYSWQVFMLNVQSNRIYYKQVQRSQYFLNNK